ncbi:rod shape-determining protein RodA [Thermophagus xiamenensis]|uniref:Cell wall polymerase n=1 Tax=Thermophagus xiamenensis TaxID=385682 RepID=A0A1I1UQW1_9BACT|nr:rod shape-determining protein RodA [Thermophagus xiamenensis]SFD73084.1 rod shape determining protein RodA [Thermophagus xiamenensis]
MNATGKSYRNIDWITVFIYSLMVIFGWLNIFAANFDPESNSLWAISTEPVKQLIWIGVSLVTIGIIFLIDSKFFVEFAYIFLGLSIAMLLMALLFGMEINGAKAWFKIGFVRFQPAELTKVAASLALARVMSRYGFQMNKIRHILKVGLVVLLPALIILLQNDTGSALVYFSFFLVLFREGMPPVILFLGFLALIVFILSLLFNTLFILIGLFFLFTAFVFYSVQKKLAIISLSITIIAFSLITGISFFLENKLGYVLPLILSISLTSIFLVIQSFFRRLPRLGTGLLILWLMIAYTYSNNYVFNSVLSDYQRNRILVVLGIENDPLGVGYNVNQSKIAIGSGGFAGKGFLQGTQTKFDFVPEQSTDFIFCTVGEEWGFLGTVSVLALFLSLLLRIIFLAERQHSAFSRIYGYCVVSIFFVHMAINIGMTIGLAPVIGIPLPFFSYGGSSFWGFTLLLFIFLKLDTNRNELIR